MERDAARGEGAGSLNRRICIVDDDVSILRALGRLLMTAGFTVDTFTSAEEFLATPRAVVPQCIVLDVRLGGMSGLALHERLLGAGCSIPVVFITGHDDAAVDEWVQASGVQCLRKPFDEQALIDAIEQAAWAR